MQPAKSSGEIHAHLKKNGCNLENPGNFNEQFRKEKLKRLI